MSQVKEKEAVEGQFGGLEHQQHPGHTPNWKMPRISNAYMLVTAAPLTPLARLIERRVKPKSRILSW